MIGHIYCIYHNNEVCYVGSTIQILNKRWSDYSSKHDKPDRPEYNYKIHRMMREHGISNFQMELLEAVEVEDTSKLKIMEDGWMDTFEELGIELYNTRKAYLTREEAQQKKRAQNKEQIQCSLCGTWSTRGNIRGHQSSKKCQRLRTIYQIGPQLF